MYGNIGHFQEWYDSFKEAMKGMNYGNGVFEENGEEILIRMLANKSE